MDGKEAEALALRLEAHPDYRVLRRLDAGWLGAPLAGEAVSQAVVLDTETTGTDPAEDRVIEIALVKFEYDRASGEVGRVLDVYDGLEDPGRPIPPESTAIHHITDAMVAGKRFDERAIERVLDGVGVVIAHSAGFDRPFVERRLPGFAALAWACSVHEVPWDALGLGGRKLEYLAYRYGFFYEGHRAEIDCRALLEVLRRPVPGQTKADAQAMLPGLDGEAVPGGVLRGRQAGACPNALALLLESARVPTLRVWAIGSAFETKDVLKARGYRWESERRVWFGEVGAADREAELAWLKDAVYGGKGATIEVETIDARVRWSERSGAVVRVRL